MFKGHPKGLFALALANTGERFGYYTMVAVFALFLRANFGLDAGVAGSIYSTFLGLVYFMPLIGGILADKFGFGRMVTIGITIMFAGYLLLSVPLGGDTLAMVAMLGSLLLISVGTGLFKGNLQVMVGNLYDDPKYADKRDSAFSLFYMAINIGALFAPTAAVEIKEWAETALGYTSNDAYHFSFAVACASLIVSMAIYYIFRPTFRHVEGGARKAGAVSTEEELSPAETKARVVALCLVFAVVIFFWMAFHQNGLALTYFADEFTAKTSEGVQSMAFNVWNLVVVIIAVYAAFSAFQSDTKNGKIASWVVVLAAVAFLVYKALNVTGTVDVSAPIFQHFNPFYVVALTPVSMAIFGSLAKKGKEPSAPRKIAYGMLIAAAGFAVMAFGSMGLLTPDEQAAAGEAGTFVSANWLISTYLVLTFAELLLSPMGISFVSKVAPPKLKGMMMGGWFVATAIGNMLVAVGGLLWGGIPLWIVWSVFIALCLISALFMFAMMKRLESATK
ncbi:MAG: peptide MFS transporter [Rikenellaceae bacterium]|nr:peptide MFS transporter [Rikenellaceae bacterium]